MPRLNHPTCFIRAAAYAAFGGYDERYRIAMDYELLRRFWSRGAAFQYVPQVIANMSAGGASDAHLLRRYAEVLEIASYHPKAFYFVARHRLLRATGRMRAAVSGLVGPRTP